MKALRMDGPGSEAVVEIPEVAAQPVACSVVRGSGPVDEDHGCDVKAVAMSDA